MSPAWRTSYRTTEGVFAVPVDFVDWSTHVYQLVETPGLRFSISRNEGAVVGLLTARLRDGARRHLRRVVFLRDEEPRFVFGTATVMLYTFEAHARRRLEGRCIFQVGGTVFSALIEGEQGSAANAEQVLRHFLSSIQPHPEGTIR